MIKRSEMQHGVYYWGHATKTKVKTARWSDARECFICRFYDSDEGGSSTFIIELNHAEDENGYEVFTPTEIVTWGTDEIPLD